MPNGPFQNNLNLERIEEQPDLQRQLEEQRAMHAEVSGAVVNVAHVSRVT